MLWIVEKFMGKSQIKFMKEISDLRLNNFVYLLLARSNGRFKIGHTRSPFNRINDLGGRKNIDDESIIFSVGTQCIAHRVEHHLQQVFSAHRLTGEWFIAGNERDRRCVFNGAAAYLIENRKLLGNLAISDGGCWILRDFYAFFPMTPFEDFDS